MKYVANLCKVIAKIEDRLDIILSLVYYVVTTTSCIRVDFSVTAKNYALLRSNLIHKYHHHPHYHPPEMR